MKDTIKNLGHIKTMVNFNNDTTIGASAVDIQRVSILQRRYDFIEAFEDYKKKKLLGVNVNLNIIRARLGSLFYELQATIKRRLKEEEYKRLKNICLNKPSEDDIEKAFFEINEELDKMKLIRIDSKKVYDFSIAEEDNKQAGL